MSDQKAEKIIRSIARKELDRFLKSGVNIQIAYKRMWKEIEKKFPPSYIEKNQDQICDWCSQVQLGYTIDHGRDVLN